MVSSGEILYIIELIYFTPALPVAIYICTKHSWSRQNGWFLLFMLSLIRLVGSCCGIAAYQVYTNTSLWEAALILESIGSATLVAAFTGIVNRIADGSSGSPFRGQLRKMLQLLGLAAVVLGIVGGTQMSETDMTNSYRKAAVILILVQFLASIVVFASCTIHFRQILDVDRKLYFCVALAAPFLCVRVIYAIISAFDANSSTFSMLSNAVLAVALRGCLDVAMEIITFSLFALGGFIAPKVVQGKNSTDTRSSSTEYGSTKEQYMAPNAQYEGTIRH